MSSEGNQINKAENAVKYSVSVSRKVVNAVNELQGKKGVSLSQLKRFLKNSKHLNTTDADVQILLAVRKNLDKGILMKDGNNYKIKETKRRRSRSKGRKKSRSRKSPAAGRKRSRSRKRGGSRRRKTSGRRKKSTGKRKSKRRSRRSRRSPAAAAAAAPV